MESGTAERWHLRVLQRFVVQAREREARAWLADGDVVETIPGWFLLRNEARYDRRFGLIDGGSSYDASALVA